MRRIFKYRLEITCSQTINMPSGAVVLTAQFQGSSLFIWALVEVERLMAARHFRIFGTGHTVEAYDISDLKYIATVQQHEGQFVWHLFEEGQEVV